MNGRDKRGRDSEEEGFTLVEVLVALAVFGLIAILLTQSLSFALRAWRDSNARAFALERNLASYDLLRAELIVALPYYGSPNDPTQLSSIRGDRTSLRVATRGPLSLGPRGIVWMVLGARESPTGITLTAAWSQDPDEKAAIRLSSGEAEIPLLDHLKDIEFSYFGEPSAGIRPQWMNHWARNDRPPDLVRITADFIDPVYGEWPDLIVHIRTDTPSRCHFDQVSRICRL